MILSIYKLLLSASAPILNGLLHRRLRQGKEDPDRIQEKRAIPSQPRPDCKLFIWLHAASVGESQSALALIKRLLEENPSLHILVTTVTRTSAQRMQDTLPDRAFHQYMPLDRPQWVTSFLEYWRPDCVLWMESEIWPNMLNELRQRHIPAALINARLSNNSYKKWRLIKSSIRKILESFSVILTQSEHDATHFRSLGASNVHACGNLKYSAKPLPYDEHALTTLKNSVQNRPIIVYASTHASEEVMAAHIHEHLQAEYPDLLSIIIPRHPDRSAEILKDLTAHSPLTVTARTPKTLGSPYALPSQDTQIYLADTLGEMGLFYRLSHIVYVGRSLSQDGGGGHNPLEPALLDCAVLHGLHIQNLRDIYDEMMDEDACICASDQKDLESKFMMLLRDPDILDAYATKAQNFSNQKMHVIDDIMTFLNPLITTTQTTQPSPRQVSEG